MTKFDDFIKNFASSECTEDRVKLEIKKMTIAAKLPDTLNMNAICLALEEDGVGIIQYLAKINEVKILDVILRLLDKTQQEEIQRLLTAAITEVITSSHIASYDIIAKNLDEQLAQIKQFVKHKALRVSTYRFIMHVFANNMDDLSKEAVLAIAQNNNDLAYLLEKFTKLTLMEAFDSQKNNVLHLALHSHNKNVFRYVVNHAGTKLLYDKNALDITPIDMVYADIQASAVITQTYDYSQLMLLDQAGADLETSMYTTIREAYRNLSDEDHRFLPAKQVKPDKEIHAVSFNGGGAKGQAFIAAYREALDRQILKVDVVKHYAGTSAGAITAGIFALNFSIQRCNEELNKFEFKKLMSFTTTTEISAVKDLHVKRWVESFQQGAYYSLITDIVTTLASETFWRAGPVMTAVKQLANEVTGIFKPTYLRETLERLVEERIADTELKSINPAHITFKDLEAHPNIFKQLTVYITNLSTGNMEKCSAKTTPNMSIIDGIVYSASFPIFFEAGQKYEIITNAEGVRVRKEVLIDGKPVWCCDGGVLKNDPVDAFDTTHFNEHTLTFMLVSSDAKKLHEGDGTAEYQETKSTVQVLNQLYKISRSAERKNVHADTRNHGRIVYIDTKKVGTLDFDHAAENAPILETAGQDAVIDYLHRRSANIYSALRAQTISLLMSYNVAKYSTNGGGQVVKINAGQKLTPVQILRVYATASESEVYTLRSIVNPNQRDHRGVSAIAIASQLKFVATKERLMIAGARPATVSIDLGLLPDYLQCDEKFLFTAMSDDDLAHRASALFENKRLAEERQVLTMSLNNGELKGQELAYIIESLHVQIAKLQTTLSESEHSFKEELEELQIALQVQKLDSLKQQSTLQDTIESNQQSYAAERQSLVAKSQAKLESRQNGFDERQKALNTQLVELRTTLEATVEAKQAYFDTALKSLNDKLVKVQATMPTILEEKASTNRSLHGKLQENTLLRKKYYYPRNTRNIENALEALRQYKAKLVRECDKDNLALQHSVLATMFSVYKSYLTANLKLKQTKMQGIDEVLGNIMIDFNQSASEIIHKAKQNNAGMFNGFFSHRAKTLCNQLIAAEDNIGKACGGLKVGIG
jgi:predicted acylesterase/phospholipase RssA